MTFQEPTFKCVGDDGNIWCEEINFDYTVHVMMEISTCGVTVDYVHTFLDKHSTLMSHHKAKRKYNFYWVSLLN